MQDSCAALLSTKRKSDRYLLVYFPFLLIAGEMEELFLLGDRRILLNKIHFRWTTAHRTKKKSDRYLVVYFPFLLRSGEMEEILLLATQRALQQKINFCWKI